MDEKNWDAADIAVVSVKLQQHLHQLLVAKGLVSQSELSHMVGDLKAKLAAEPGAEGAVQFLDRAFPVAAG